MGRLGLPEIVLGLGVFWLIPVVASAWALLTLHRVRAGQHAISVQIETLARMMQGGDQPG